MVGRGTYSGVGVAVGDGDAAGVSSSSAADEAVGESDDESAGDGEADGTTAATCGGVGRQGVSSSASARAWPSGVAIEGAAALVGANTPAISVNATATASALRTTGLL
jgi:hypothetical protein